RGHRAALLRGQRLARESIKIPRPLGNVSSRFDKSRRVFQPQNVLGRDPAGGQFRKREVNASALGVRPDIAQNIGQLQSFAQVNRIFAASRVPVTEDLDAQQTYDGGDTVAVKLQILIVLIPVDLEIHFHSAQ